MAAALVQANGAKKKLDLIVVHPSDMAVIVNDNSTKIQYMRTGDAKEGKFQMGAETLGLFTSFGLVPIKQSIFAVPKFANLISSETWYLNSSGKPGVLDGDGLEALRVGTDDAYETRLGAQNIVQGCSAPGYNGICRFA